MNSKAPGVAIELIYSPFINFAMQQNHVPVIRKFTIRNLTSTDLKNVSVQINAEPEFAIGWSKQPDLLPAGQLIDVGIVDLKLKIKYLAELTERLSGNFAVVVRTEDEVLFEQVYDINILSYEQWNGVGTLPEMLAAFVTPNHPDIATVIIRASAILQQWTGKPSFDAYQSQNPDRVRKQMAAIFEAIAQMNLVYCSVPASFEESGQRIRMCDTIFKQRMANCLDLSLLYTSCLEAVGIHPIIIVVKGHAFAGGWLIEESFPDSVNDDISLLTKRTADGIDEIVLVEATCMNAGETASFDEAVRSANYKLIKPDEFVISVDIRRARFSGIRPLPLRIQTVDGWEIVEEQMRNRNTSIPEEIVPTARLVNVDSIDVSKVQLWERKLLDLTLRNNLLNLRITRNTVQLLFTQLHKLEDALAAGTEFQVLAKPTDWDNPLRNAGVYQAVNMADPIADLVNHEFTQKRLRSYLPEIELNTSLTNLYRSSRLSLEENGANTLYISLGMLRWFETGESERARYAPILLMPVEIVRKTALKGFIIRTREEETMMNITLLEMLRQDFGVTIGGLETLPKDESGIDLRRIFNIIRQGIMTHSRWDVEEQVFLGIFSFSKFIMWNDIHRNAAVLSQNKQVASLISGKIEWQVEDEPANTEDFDEQHHPATIALPISADASQLEAITESVNERSFVLHGPPGTGKSQTITNIISNALYNGKRVLFVAEKMAALSVVKDRLEKIGLGPFCLELHSNKSKKSSVLEQLKKTIDITKTYPPENFRAEAERIKHLRNELNAYVKALHKKYPFGSSLFDCFAVDARLDNVPHHINFNHTALETLSRAQVTDWQDHVEELQAAGSLLPYPHNHALRLVTVTQYSQQLKADTRDLLEKSLNVIKEFKKTAEELCTKQQLEVPLDTEAQYDALNTIAHLLLTLPDIPASLFLAENLEHTMAQLISLSEHGIERDAKRNELLQNFQSPILEVHAEETLSDWASASSKWFVAKYFQQAAIKKSLAKLSSSGSINADRVMPLLHQVIAFQKEQGLLSKNEKFLSGLLGFMWNGGECNWQQVLIMCNTVIQVNRAVIQLTGNTIKARLWRDHIAVDLDSGAANFQFIQGKYLKDYSASHAALNSAKRKLTDMLGIDFSMLEILIANYPANLEAQLTKVLGGIEHLKDWISWLNTRHTASNAGLEQVVAVYETGMIASPDLITTYQKGLARSCAAYIISKEPALSSFNGKLFEDKIRRFREMSQRYERLTKEELYAKLAARIPDFTRESAQSSEIGLLQRTIRNNGRAMPIRKLFDSISNLLPRIAPCMLMSPISVAQYFDATAPKFDLVVFDEASQMPTCEAVGAIARANNMIVVGDPKQMPPTSFFTSANNVDEDHIEMEDLESILDDCLALSMPSKHLLWHYRSKHESLIAFSNAQYYENRLLTFPSPDDISSKVTYIHVDGFYDRGKTRQNSFEANAVIAEIKRRLSDPVLAKKSIGVVTFSSVQQILIQNLFDELLKANPQLEAVALENAEPIFIKNLENVQGDERDVILFSVGYGPDKDGRISLNFGPLNRDGGWRRLNVAVSRARYEMKVYSTLRAEQIDITRSSTEGVAGIKAFLEYAEKGRSTIGTRKAGTKNMATGFEWLLADRIRLAGYEVHTNIGCSGYRIDIGIVNSQKPAEYILGILCDGEMYNAAKTARDREIIQQDVLTSLGWTIYRAWSTDWWENPERVLAGILEAIKKAEARQSNNLVPQTAEISTPEVESTVPDLTINASAHQSPVSRIATEYEMCRLEIELSTSSDDFLLDRNVEKIRQQILSVLNTESPITKNLLARRLLSAWGITKMGTRLNAKFEKLLNELEIQQTAHDNTVVLWSDAVKPGAYNDYRVATVTSQKRDAEDIPLEEITNGIREILTHQVSLPKEDLIREGSKLFGFARAGTNVEAAIRKGIDKAISCGFAFEKDGRVVFKE